MSCVYRIGGRTFVAEGRSLVRKCLADGHPGWMELKGGWAGHSDLVSADVRSPLNPILRVSPRLASILPLPALSAPQNTCNL